MAELSIIVLYDKLVKKDYPTADIKKFVAYVDNANREEKKKPNDKKSVTKNDTNTLYSLFVKYYELGVVIDGVDAVVSGYNMVMITYHGYKNRIIRSYPESEIDLQLVREGDDYNFAKESGAVVYSHNIADPFSLAEKPIVGAYVVIKNKRGEFLELLNKSDYEKMQQSSKMSYLWQKWPSEFWLKSVIKRACKRHFYDLVAAIDKQDNEDFGADNVKASEDKKHAIIAAAKEDNASSNS